MSEHNVIPVMDDPLGKHWDQPSDIRSAPMDDTHIVLTPEQWARLSTYSSTLPTGVYPGKCWLRREPGRDLLVWYGAENAQRMCPIMFREALVLQPTRPSSMTLESIDGMMP